MILLVPLMRRRGRRGCWDRMEAKWWRDLYWRWLPTDEDAHLES